MAVQGRIDILVIREFYAIAYQLLNFVIANNFSELTNEISPFLLAKSRLKIANVVYTPVH